MFTYLKTRVNAEVIREKMKLFERGITDKVIHRKVASVAHTRNYVCFTNGLDDLKNLLGPRDPKRTSRAQ